MGNRLRLAFVLTTLFGGAACTTLLGDFSVSSDAGPDAAAADGTVGVDVAPGDDSSFDASQLDASQMDASKMDGSVPTDGSSADSKTALPDSMTDGALAPDTNVACGALGQLCCTGTCKVGLTCGSNFICDATTSDIGKTCTSGSGCQSQLCPEPQGTCSSECVDGGLCINVSWTCSPYTVPNGPTLNACLCNPTSSDGGDGCNGLDDNCNGTIDEQGLADCQNRFGPGEACMGGSCICVGTVCGGKCVDTQTDYNNCGRCGRPCGGPGGGSCVGGVCQAYEYEGFGGAFEPNGVAVDDSYVYVALNASPAYGKVVACGNGSGGGCVGPVDWVPQSPGIPAAYGVAVAGGTLVASGSGVSDGTLVGGGRIESCAVTVSSPPAVCTPATEGSNGGGTAGFGRIATDGTNIAVNDDAIEIHVTTVGAASENYASMTTPYHTGANDDLNGMTIGGGYLYWTVGEAGGVAGSDAHKIFRCQLGAGSGDCGPSASNHIVFTSATLLNPGPILYDATNKMIYWLDLGSVPFTSSDGSLQACDVSTGTCTTPTALANNLSSPVDLAQDGTNVYFATSNNVLACAKAGCALTPTVIAASEFGVQFLAADPFSGGTVYWTNDFDVRRVVKP